jgi:hypothetical protein
MDFFVFADDSIDRSNVSSTISGTNSIWLCFQDWNLNALWIHHFNVLCVSELMKFFEAKTQTRQARVRWCRHRTRWHSRHSCPVTWRIIHVTSSYHTKAATLYPYTVFPSHLQKNTSKTGALLARHTHTHLPSLFNISTCPDNRPCGTLSSSDRDKERDVWEAPCQGFSLQVERNVAETKGHFSEKAASKELILKHRIFLHSSYMHQDIRHITSAKWNLNVLHCN